MIANTIDRWEAAVRAEMKLSQCSRAQAVQTVARRDETLHAEYLNEFNSRLGRAATFSVPPASAEAPSGGPISLWDKLKGERMAGGMTKSEAVRSLASDEPQLHADYLNAVNRKYGRPANFTA
jgi:hypothetical protein